MTEDRIRNDALNDAKVPIKGTLFCYIALILNIVFGAVLAL